MATIDDSLCLSVLAVKTILAPKEKTRRRNSAFTITGTKLFTGRPFLDELGEYVSVTGLIRNHSGTCETEGKTAPHRSRITGAHRRLVTALVAVLRNQKLINFTTGEPREPIRQRGKTTTWRRHVESGPVRCRLPQRPQLILQGGLTGRLANGHLQVSPPP